MTDYKNDSVNSLFVRLLFPTLAGMLSGSVMNLTDGIFVGRLVNNMALAAVNVAAPLFMCVTGVALMFGIGCSVSASVALSQNDNRGADLHFSRGILFAVIASILIAYVAFFFKSKVAFLFGSTDLLQPYVIDYMTYTAPFMPFYAVMFSGLFLIRLDGSPGFAMFCNIIPSVLNIFLDWLFIAKFNLGIKGAAIATSISGVTGGLLVIFYLLFKSKRLKFTKIYRISMSEDTWYSTLLKQFEIGFSGLLNEIAISVTLVAGNFAFGKLLHEPGVSAYGIICYCMPLLFMINSAISASLQPIVSFDFGSKRYHRVRQALKLSLTSGLISSCIIAVLFNLFCQPLVALFVGDQCQAYSLAVYGLSLFSIGLPFSAVNVIAIGYCQSVNQAFNATLYTFLRGYLFLILSFVFLPQIAGVNGLWLAVPATEILTFIVVLLSVKVKNINK